MTDERIKEEYNKWSVSQTTDAEVAFYESDDGFKSDLLIGFYAGFRTAERLAKIEALEEVLDIVDGAYPKQEILSMLSELKESN